MSRVIISKSGSTPIIQAVRPSVYIGTPALNDTVLGASTLTTLNRLTKVTATGTIGMTSIAEPTAGNLTGVVSLRASSSAGLLLENSNGDDVLLLGAGPSQGITAYGQINGTSLQLSSLTSGRILIAGSSGLLSDDSALVWDATNDSLGIGTAATSTTQIKTAKTFTSTSAVYGIDHRPIWAPSATSASQAHGAQLRFDCNATAGAITAPATTPNSAVMCQAVCAAGSVTAMAGFSCEVYNLGSGTLGTAIAVHARTAQNTGGGTVTNAMGLRVEPQTVGTNRYGIDIGAISGGTTNFAIRTSTGLVSFGDSLAVGASALLGSERLLISGGGSLPSVSATQIAFSNGGAAFGAGITAAGNMQAGDGSAASPSFRTSENHGWYRASASSIGISVAGTLALTIGSSSTFLQSSSTFTVFNTTPATSTISAACVVSGGFAAGGGAFFGGDVTRVGSSAAQIEYLIQNTGTGTSSRSRYRATNAAGDIAMVAGVYNASNTQASYGFSLGNWANLECGGAGVNGLVIGCTSVDKPIVFGINASEVARFTGGTLTTGAMAIKYTTDATAIGAAGFICDGGGSFAKSLWVGGTAGNYINIANSTGELRVNATKVVSSRKTGWTAATGTATRTGFATGTATTTQVAEALKALMDDLISHGLIGA